MSNTDTVSRFRRGLAAVWFVLLGLVLVGVTGVALDTGLVLLVANQLQNASDAGALAGTRLVQTDITEARQAALDIAFENAAAKSPVQIDLNPENVPTGDIVVMKWHRATAFFLWSNALDASENRRSKVWPGWTMFCFLSSS